MKSQLSTSSLEKLRKALPHGGVGRLAERLKLSQSQISKVLYGHSQNDSVIEAAIELAKENADKVEKFKSEIESL